MTKEEFATITSNYDSHRPLLWEALEATKGLVIELGCGYGSTPFLWAYCQAKGRVLLSYENNREWFDKMRSEFPHIQLVKDWDKVRLASEVLFIDHAPGERRKVDIARAVDSANIIIAHDTEPAADHGYQMRGELEKYAYMIDYKTDGAWATAVSNSIDVTKFKF